MGKHTRNALFVTGLFIAVLIITSAIVNQFSDNFFETLTVSVVISWVIALVGYYAWALYFYNVNYGWSEADWEKYDSGDDKFKNDPKKNPHNTDSLGLPPGTIRGTVALTLLIGGVAMTIAALSFGDRLNENELLIDNFDFFKKAFLMMIAFYFGTKSLEILQGSQKNKSTDESETDEGDGSSDNGKASKDEAIRIEVDRQIKERLEALRKKSAEPVGEEEKWPTTNNG